MKYIEKPIPVEAHQWNTNGDHPNDQSEWIEDETTDVNYLSEGKVVRRFRRPDVSGDTLCQHCERKMHVHGWIDTLEGGHIVCPGDYIITGIRGEHYPIKPDIFKETYMEVEE